MKSTGDLPITTRNSANRPAAMASANRGITTYSEFTRSLTAKSDRVVGDAVFSITSRGASVATGASDTGLLRALGRGADHAFEQIVHLVEERVEIVVGLVDHDLAGLVVLERPDVDRLPRLQPLDRGESGLLPFGAGARAERGVLDIVGFVSARQEVGQRLAGCEVRGVAPVDGDPLVFGAGDEALRRQWRLARVVAAALDPALLRRLDDHLRSVDVAGDDVAARVDERVGGLRFADGHRPVAGEDHLHDRFRIDRSRAEHERIDVAQHARDRLGGDEAKLVRLGRETRGDAVDIVRLIEVAEIGAGVFRIRVLVPERDRKSIRLNSSHVKISYAVFCLKKKKNNNQLIFVIRKIKTTSKFYP